MTQSSLQPKFIKPFSRGQITLPKDYRDFLGIDSNSWLFLTIQDDSLIIKPVKKENFITTKKPRILKAKISQKTYLKNLLKIKSSWFSEKDLGDYKKIRQEIEERFRQNEASFN